MKLKHESISNSSGADTDMHGMPTSVLSEYFKFNKMKKVLLLQPLSYSLQHVYNEAIPFYPES
jgi:hypothetical protein